MFHDAVHPLRAATTLVLFLGSSACDNTSASEPTAAAKADSPAAKGAKTKPLSNAAACGPERRVALEREMLRGCVIAPSILRDDVPPAPWTVETRAPKRPPHTRQISLRADGVHVEANPPITIEEWGQGLPPPEPSLPRLVWELSIESDLPGATVAEALGHLTRTGNTKGSIVLATPASDDLPTPVDPARLAALDEELDGSDPATRATTIAAHIADAMPPCAALREAFSAVATVPPEQRCSTLATGLAEATVACDCPDMDEVQTLVYGIAVGTQVPTSLGVAIPTVLGADATAHTGATWGEIVAGLEKADFGALAIAAR